MSIHKTTWDEMFNRKDYTPMDKQKKEDIIEKVERTFGPNIIINSVNTEPTVVYIQPTVNPYQDLLDKLNAFKIPGDSNEILS